MIIIGFVASLFVAAIALFFGWHIFERDYGRAKMLQRDLINLKNIEVRRRMNEKLNWMGYLPIPIGEPLNVERHIISEEYSRCEDRLGRIPTLSEFLRSTIVKEKHIVREFGGYHTLISENSKCS